MIQVETIPVYIITNLLQSNDQSVNLIVIDFYLSFLFLYQSSIFKERIFKPSSSFHFIDLDWDIQFFSFFEETENSGVSLVCRRFKKAAVSLDHSTSFNKLAT